MLKPFGALALALSIFSGWVHADAASQSGSPMVCEREIIRASARHGVPIAILYAIGMTETGGKGALHPFALNVSGKPYFAGTREEALIAFAEARTAGVKLIDIGCMQVNHFYHGARFPSAEEMFDPARNVDYAARFLVSLKQREGTWTMAAARYHAGPDNDAAQKVYVCRVIGNMVASGFGVWTEQARALCQTE